MFERKDLLKASFLFLVIFVVMVTLSQILVVHKRNHGNTKSRDRQKMKAIISQIEAIISGMMRPDFIPMDKHTEVLKAIKYAAKIKRQLDKASSMQRKTMRVKLLRKKLFRVWCGSEKWVGSLRTGIIDTKNYTFYKEYSDIISGGAWQPSECVARQRVAIVIPFRDRQKHLEQLQYNLIPILKRQQLNFRFFVVEQNGNHTFNKGRIMNAAFLEARKFDDFDCFVFHDVDMMPEDDRNMYTCTDAARHMSPAVDKFLYVLPYTQLVGGVLSMKPDVFIAVNGYSNLYWGWGAEDDDMAAR
ncbi:beta-1,4-N-acetylgalactosaminyltransferase bre-4-like [Dreissena polymorpha]|uniref:beta-1,4-N-acetylgalactosaminyltransferase bre-4-like n=1 Tax=Dreissena polymorpha TaxID=45954 RepID=UPI00226476BE|nr:beta-1,4-N-acetylgalactosaminyltransferase bre-4-like [Dreissena polymorpha]